jgi:hypothetical protein
MCPKIFENFSKNFKKFSKTNFKNLLKQIFKKFGAYAPVFKMCPKVLKKV